MIHTARVPRVLLSTAFGFLVAALAHAQESAVLDAALDAAAEDGHRVLVHFRGGDAATDSALTAAMDGTLEGLLRDGYRVVRAGATAPRGAELAAALGLELRSLPLPALVVVGSDGTPLARLDVDGLREDATFEVERARGFLERHRAYHAASKSVADGDLDRAMSELEKAFEAGFAPAAAVSSDRSFRPLRADPDYRAALSRLVEKHATASHIVMVDSVEPGQRIRLEGQVVDAATGEPLPDAKMQLFHTDNRGEYRPGMTAGGGAGNPRLFGWLRTDAAGRFTVDTIMPIRYPDSTVPRHVHYRVWADGHPTLESECFFDSDPGLTERTRRRAPERNFPIVELEKNEDGLLVGPLVVRVPGDE